MRCTCGENEVVKTWESMHEPSQPSQAGRVRDGRHHLARRPTIAGWHLVRDSYVVPRGCRTATANYHDIGRRPVHSPVVDEYIRHLAHNAELVALRYRGVLKPSVRARLLHPVLHL